MLGVRGYIRPQVPVCKSLFILFRALFSTPPPPSLPPLPFPPPPLLRVSRVCTLETVVKTLGGRECHTWTATKDFKKEKKRLCNIIHHSSAFWCKLRDKGAVKLSVELRAGIRSFRGLVVSSTSPRFHRFLLRAKLQQKKKTFWTRRCTVSIINKFLLYLD